MNHINMRAIPLLLLALVSGYVFPEDRDDDINQVDNDINQVDNGIYQVDDDIYQIDKDIYQAVSELTQKGGVSTIAVGEIKLNDLKLNAGLPLFVKDLLINSASGREADYRVATDYTDSAVSGSLIGSGGSNAVEALIEGTIYPLPDGAEVRLRLTSTATKYALASGNAFTIPSKELERRDLLPSIPKTYTLVLANDDAGTERVSQKVKELMHEMNYTESDTDPGYKVTVKVTVKEDARSFPAYPKTLQPSVEVKITWASGEKGVPCGKTLDPIKRRNAFDYNRAYTDIEEYLGNNLIKRFSSILEK